MTDYFFKTDGNWDGSWDGHGRIRSENLNSAISVDPSMHGSGTGANPDELLLSALASCYMITLGIRLDKEKISIAGISMHSEGTVTNHGGLHFEQVAHQLVITVHETLTPSLRRQLVAAVKQAETDCMIGKAVRGNVHILVSPVFKESALSSEKS